MEKFLKEDIDQKPRIYEIKSVADFVDLSTWLYSSDNVIFRGQRKDWELLPSITHFKDHSALLNNEKETLEQFKRESIPYINCMPKSDWQWLALAQHYRLPTRLLDWTNNPLAALWFAVEMPAVDSNQAIVWAYCYDNTKIVYDSLQQESPFLINQTEIYNPEHITPNIRAQSGVFTVHHRYARTKNFEPLEKIKDADKILTKIEILASNISTIRYHLSKLNINAASLFPSIEGIVKKIRYENILYEDDIRY